MKNQAVIFSLNSLPIFELPAEDSFCQVPCGSDFLNHHTSFQAKAKRLPS
jgi:hypothetical protein